MKPMSATDLPQIPIIDARDGGAPDIARAAPTQLDDLLRTARRLVTPPLLSLPVVSAAPPSHPYPMPRTITNGVLGIVGGSHPEAP